MTVLLLLYYNYTDELVHGSIVQYAPCIAGIEPIWLFDS